MLPIRVVTIRKVVYVLILFVLFFNTSNINFAYSDNTLFINDECVDTYQNMYTENDSNYIRLDLLLDYNINVSKIKYKFFNLTYYICNNRYIAFWGKKVVSNTLIEDMEYKIVGNNFFIPVKYLNQIDSNINVAWNDKYSFIWIKTNDNISEADLIRNNVKKLGIKDIDGIISPINATKFAYLTFDDGPSKHVTPQILDILKEYNVKATFFVNGVNISGKEEILKREVNEGHTIGNHTYSHKAGMYTSINIFKDEVISNSNKIYEVTGYTSNVFRSPYGNKLTDSYKAFLKENNYTTYYWNVDPGDSVVKEITADQIIGKVRIQIQNKNDVIIILHDMDNKIQTAKSLRGVIKTLWENGYELKALDPNIKVNGAVRIY